MLGTDAQLQGGQGRLGTRLQPVQRRPRQQLLGTDAQALDLDFGHRLAMGQYARYTAHLGSTEVQQHQPWLALGLGQYQRGLGLLAEGERRDPAIEQPAAFTRLRLEFDTAGTGTGVDGQGQDHLGRCGPFSPARRLAQGKVRQGCRCQLMAPQRYLAQAAALGLEHQHQLGQAQVAATGLLGNRQGMQPGFHAQAPEIAHHRFATAVPLAQGIVVTVIGEQAVGHLGDGALVFAQLEVHDASCPATGRNSGKVCCSSKTWNSTCRRWPICNWPGATPTRPAIRRTPSSSSIRPMGLGCSNGATTG
ncbi:hypothetical protein D3C80_1263810 [compost metagenome]